MLNSIPNQCSHFLCLYAQKLRNFIFPFPFFVIFFPFFLITSDIKKNRFCPQKENDLLQCLMLALKYFISCKRNKQQILGDICFTGIFSDGIYILHFEFPYANQLLFLIQIANALGLSCVIQDYDCHMKLLISRKHFLSEMTQSSRLSVQSIVVTIQLFIFFKNTEF